MTEAPEAGPDRDREAPPPADETGRGGPRSDRAALAVALCVFLVAGMWAFRDLAGEDPTRVTLLPNAVPYGIADGDPSASWLAFTLDQRFVIWVIARNARTWLSHPTRMFDAEICHPAPQSLSLGEPVLTLGLLAAPAWLVSRDPIFTYNAVLVLLPLISALAMYLAVKQWTGMSAAGIVAGVVYAFHVVKISDCVHVYGADSTWTLFALYFFGSWLEQGRWRDILGLAFATVLQIGGSVYPLIGGAIIGVSFAIYGLRRLGVRRTRPLQWIVLVALVSTALYLAFAPFLAKSDAGELTERTLQFFLAWSMFLPGQTAWPGWLMLALCVAAFVPLRGGGERDLGPRWPLLAATLALTWLAAGGNAGDRWMAELRGLDPPPALPNPYSWLQTVVPAFGNIRAPSAIATSAHLTLAALAGLGAARVLERVPLRYSRLARALLVAAALLATLQPGIPGAHAFHPHLAAPSPDLQAFFVALEEAGSTGPILEIPVDRLGRQYGTMSILMAAYHHRPTSRCYNSFLPPEVEETGEIASRLPDVAAIEELKGLGFTTLLIHHSPGRRDLHRLRDELDALAASPDPPVALLHRDPRRSAYEILSKGGEAEPL